MLLSMVRLGFKHVQSLEAKLAFDLPCATKMTEKKMPTTEFAITLCGQKTTPGTSWATAAQISAHHDMMLHDASRTLWLSKHIKARCDEYECSPVVI
jgi:hypothetical protein